MEDGEGNEIALLWDFYEDGIKQRLPVTLREFWLLSTAK